MNEEIALRPNEDPRATRCFDQSAGIWRDARIQDDEEEIAFLDRVPTAPDAFRLDGISRDVQARCVVPSTMSRVVPGTGETIARSRPSSAFNRLDLPAFGGPTRATVIPSWTTRP